MRVIGFCLLLCAAVFCVAIGSSYAFSMVERVEKLSAENQELRLRDANRVRIGKLHAGTYRVDVEAVANAAYDMGTDGGVLLCVAQVEKGGPIYEMGHSGKTALIWQNVPPDRLQEYEAARTLNRALWAWAMADPARKRDAIKALGKAYTHPTNAARWAKNVSKLEAQNASRN